MVALEEVYNKRGWVIVTKAMSADLAASLADTARITMSFAAIHKQGIASHGGESNYYVFDGHRVRTMFEALYGWYEGTRSLVERIVRRDVILSPYSRSAVNIKAYPKGSGCQGWHYDTNPVSVLLFLSNQGSPTVVTDLTGETIGIEPYAGRMLIMKGREVLHHVPPTSATRITAPCNYYHPDDQDRPDWIDAAIYENAEPPHFT